MEHWVNHFPTRQWPYSLKSEQPPKTWITETLVQTLLTLNITQDSPITAQTQHYTRQPNHNPHSVLHKTAQSLPTLNITQDSGITAHTRHHTKQWSNGTQNELQKHQASCCPLSVWQKMVARQDDKQIKTGGKKGKTITTTKNAHPIATTQNMRQRDCATKWTGKYPVQPICMTPGPKKDQILGLSLLLHDAAWHSTKG